MYENSNAPQSSPHISSPHAVKDHCQLLEDLNSSTHGLTTGEAAFRLSRVGPNVLPRVPPSSLAVLFLRQFLSPLIYILLAAALVSMLLEEWSDALFITLVLLLNAAIGTAQEYGAQRSADALQGLVRTRARVVRSKEAFEVDAEDLVPGDLVLLEEGSKVPADVRLLSSQSLSVDESLLTGESLPVSKDADAVLSAETSLGDRINMAYAGSLVARGRGRGLVVATGLSTEVGSLASTLMQGEEVKPPLILRMERFTFRVALAVGVAVAAIFAVQIYRGFSLSEVFLQSVALAVSAIPEGLPVALTVALAIGMRRMSRRNVIVRRLVAVESLGSCNFIASDKTGTLTMNQLTVRRVIPPGAAEWRVSGEGTVPLGSVERSDGPLQPAEEIQLRRLCRTAALCNEGFLGLRDGEWVHNGDMVDVALLVLAHKAGMSQQDLLAEQPQVDQIPFESERQFAATLNGSDSAAAVVHVKGAPERVMGMCRFMASLEGDCPLNREMLEGQAQDLAQAGYRILALASGELHLGPDQAFSEEHLQGLTFLGLVGMIDPLRPEARGAVAACRDAGVQVAMVTGDHPVTSLAIARELNLAYTMDQVVTGPDLREAEASGEGEIDALTAHARVFARVEPRQKLDIVRSLIRQGHLVAVTGDGANDAPALRAAHVGVAVGKGGTDVARESSDIIITDDNFASIVAGIEEGRIGYGNIRKVIFLLISTGAAEIVLFILALATNLPLPLVAVQLLWLNLVTNGIQDVALAFEPGEGDEMKRRPHPTQEPIFNRLMLERVVLSALTIGLLAFGAYRWMLDQGWELSEARNSTVLLMVLFENVQVFNSRSELRSAFRHSPLQNPILLFGTIAAQLVHIGAMYTPWLSGVLELQPVSFVHWAQLLGIALIILIFMEVYKAASRGRF
ncbi:MAG: HAD-IC family P-type ATPase [Methanosarcinales archaeon]|nr:HAD-IC family P-type ATPase [Methanosarcinales archaeon]